MYTIFTISTLATAICAVNESTIYTIFSIYRIYCTIFTISTVATAKCTVNDSTRYTISSIYTILDIAGITRKLGISRYKSLAHCVKSRCSLSKFAVRGGWFIYIVKSATFQVYVKATVYVSIYVKATVQNKFAVRGGWSLVRPINNQSTDESLIMSFSHENEDLSFFLSKQNLESTKNNSAMLTGYHSVTHRRIFHY